MQYVVQIAGLAVLAFFFALVLHSVYRYASTIAAATDQKPAGIGGCLLLLAGCILALAFWRLAEAANIFAYVSSLQNIGNQGILAFRVTAPALIASLTAFLALHRLASGRTQAALLQTVVLFWYASVGHEMMKPFLHAGESEALVLWAFLVLDTVATLYLIFSARARNTFGLQQKIGGRKDNQMK